MKQTHDTFVVSLCSNNNEYFGQFQEQMYEDVLSLSAIPEITCKMPPSQPHTYIVTATNISMGGIVQYIVFEDYTYINGSVNITCNSSGMWEDRGNSPVPIETECE